jgi:hypothetical protein
MISRNDLFGIFYVKKPNGIRWDSYYRTIDALRHLFNDKEFTKIVEGFYLNVCGDYDSVRISYFVTEGNVQGAVGKFKRFFRENGLVEIKEPEYPQEEVVAKAYGGIGYEERFRNFLVMETKIGLEMTERDLSQARRLLAIYRWQIRKSFQEPKEYFEPTLKILSPTYNSLSDGEKDQFFADLNEWPNPPQVDWGHLMVNFILGCDWLGVFGDPNYLTPNRPLPIPEINKILERSGLGFEIPLDWRP